MVLLVKVGECAMDKTKVAKQRAQRLKQARLTAGLTLKEMAASGLINFNTLCGWELAKHGGLTARGAAKVVERLQDYRVDCSIAWLLAGDGDPPKQRLQTSSAGIAVGNATTWALKQYNALLAQAPDFLTHLVNDKSMSPQLNLGDCVAGIPSATSPNSLAEAHGEMVIAHLRSGEFIVRKLIYNTNLNEYILLATNQAYQPAFLLNPPMSCFAIIATHSRNIGSNSPDEVQYA